MITKNFILLSILFSIITLVRSQNSFTYNACSQTQILNIKTMLCEQCPINTRPSLSQNIPTSCVCEAGYIPILGTFQCELAVDSACDQITYANIFDKNGQQISSANNSCDACADNAFSNQNGTGCISCPTDMTYSVGEGCICSDPTHIKTLRGCYSKSLTSALNLGQSNSAYYEELKYLLPGCYAFQDLLSCSYMVNLCTYSHVEDTPECTFFSNLDTYSPYMFPTDSSFYMGPGTFTKDSALSLKLMLFLPTGNYVGQKQLRLPDIIRCGMPSDNSASLTIGNNIEITCTFNFLYLVQKMGTKTYQNYLYELFIADSSGKFSQVPVYINSNTQASKRFYLQNTYSSDKTISVLTSLQFSIQMNTTGYLIDPKLEVSYTSLSVQNGLITPQTAKYQEISYSVNFTYDLTNFWTGGIIIFAIINALVLVQSIIRSYIAYLNRQSPLSFFFYFAKFWSLWMFYFLFAFSGYWFITTKTTQQPYVFVPGSQSEFYPIFYTLSAVMIFLRILTVLIQKNEKLNYEVFLINWQKGHFKNSWRQIFIINSLAEFYTYRTVSTFYMLLCMMFFLVGLEWQENAAEVTNTDLTTIYSFSPLNRVFLYFVSCGVFLAVGVIFKILRRISVIQWPLPFEDFVDYCNVTNISFFFLKKKTPQAFYIHAAIQDRVEVTYKEINEAIRRGLNKNRTIAKEMSFHDHQRMYSVYISKDLEDKYNAMLRKQDEDKDQSHNISKNVLNNPKAKGKHILSPREDFVEKKLKPHLEIISREGANRTKTFAQMNLGYPPIDLRDPNNNLKTKSEVLFDENLQLVKEVFPNGDQFQQIHTIIIIFLAFILLTGSVSIAAFVTYFIDSYILNGWISHKCRKNLERMTKVKEGFML